MGLRHQARCDCGFQTEVRVGGGRRTFNEDSQFPYYCATCGIVSVNIAKLTIGTCPPCPKCGAAEVHQYGSHPVSIPLGEQPHGAMCGPADHQHATPTRVNRRTLQWGKWEANEFDNLCPACKQMTLVFDSMPLVMFD